MNSKRALLVEDRPSDIALTRRAFEKNRISNRLVFAEDEQEALVYLFAAGLHTGRNPAKLPALVLLDLKLPRVDGGGANRCVPTPAPGGCGWWC